MSFLPFAIRRGRKPFAEYRMCHVHAGPEVYVHLLSHFRYRDVEEEAWVCGAGDAPNDVGCFAVIPGDCFGDNACSTVGFGDITADVLKSLGRGVRC